MITKVEFGDISLPAFQMTSKDGTFKTVLINTLDHDLYLVRYKDQNWGVIEREVEIGTASENNFVTIPACGEHISICKKSYLPSRIIGGLDNELGIVIQRKEWDVSLSPNIFRVFKHRENERMTYGDWIMFVVDESVAPFIHWRWDFVHLVVPSYFTQDRRYIKSLTMYTF